MPDYRTLAQLIAGNLKRAYDTDDVDALCSAAVTVRAAALVYGHDPVKFKKRFSSIVGRYVLPSAKLSVLPKIVYAEQHVPSMDLVGVVGIGWPITWTYEKSLGSLEDVHHPYILPISPEQQAIRGEPYTRALVVPVWPSMDFTQDLDPELLKLLSDRRAI